MKWAAILLLLVAAPSQAQVWCPPGATWTYGMDAFGAYGYDQLAYVGDTVVGGIIGQRIDMQTATQYWPDYTPITYNYYPVRAITSLQNDVVLLWNADSLSWDTLYWFGAVPGDHWMRSGDGWDDCDPPDEIVVLDTTTIIVDGVPLKQLYISHTWLEQEGTSYITERLGWEWFFTLFPACLAVDGPTGMRCYSDNEISWSNFEFGCTSLMGLEDISFLPSILSPNPGTTHFTLQLPGGMHTIAVFDATGRRVLSVRSADANKRIDTEALPAGLYQVRAMNAGGTVAHLPWLKQ